MTSTPVVCVKVRLSQPRTYTRLKQMLTYIFLPEIQQYGVPLPFLYREKDDAL